MTITQLRQTIRDRWVNSTDLEYLTNALPNHPGSLANLETMDEVGQELTTGLHAITTPGGRRFLVATDLYRIHAVALEVENPLPSGSYRLEGGHWTRYASQIDTSQLAPYLARVDDEPPTTIQLSSELVDRIQYQHTDHPELLVHLEPGRVRLFTSADELRWVEDIYVDPITDRAAGDGQVTMQWPVMRSAVEAGMTRWSGAGRIGPYRSAMFNRLAIAIGIQVTAPAQEATA